MFGIGLFVGSYSRISIGILGFADVQDWDVCVILASYSQLPTPNSQLSP